MIQFKTLLRVGVAVGVATFGFSAQAANSNITITLPSSVTCTTSGDGTSIVCSAAGGTSPSASCSLSPSTTSMALGTSITLTMTCSNMVAGVTVMYTWGGTACSSHDQGSNTCTYNAPSTIPGTNPVAFSVTANDGTNNISKGSSITVFDPNAGGGGGSIPTACGDGTTTKVGAAFSALDGSPDSVFIGNNQTAIFPFVVPDVASGAQIKITHLQTNDNTNITPRTGYISQTPCDMPPWVAGSGQKSAQWMTGVGGVQTLTAIVDGGNTVDVGGRGVTPHMRVGDTWYLMFQNRTSSNKASCTGNCQGDVTVKAQPGS